MDEKEPKKKISDINKSYPDYLSMTSKHGISIKEIEQLDISTNKLLESFKTICSNPQLKYQKIFCIQRKSIQNSHKEETKTPQKILEKVKHIKHGNGLPGTKNTLKRMSTRSLNTVTKPQAIEIESIGRRDVVYKSALRKLRRFFKNIFKTQNLDIVGRRYINCRIGYLYQKMYQTLTTVIPEGYITDELVYFTMGIAGIRKPSELPCSNQIRQEIKAIMSCASTFSQKKYQRCLRSESFQTLIQNASETQGASWAREVLDGMGLY
ncbi:unnamed protein product [Moneuplotes crassus]|uniref:Uncharacterized protein n=1 Tax=Euplotes crassus TaxID=5936 RepID=A0AAD1Y1A4_EUPCR|nr:unnamed protein product [Moneuplotes crassus]